MIALIIPTSQTGKLSFPKWSQWPLFLLPCSLLLLRRALSSMDRGRSTKTAGCPGSRMRGGGGRRPFPCTWQQSLPSGAFGLSTFRHLGPQPPVLRLGGACLFHVLLSRLSPADFCPRHCVASILTRERTCPEVNVHSCPCTRYTCVRIHTDTHV